MSDFTSGFWNLYVAAFTIAGILGCAWLLWVMSTRRPAPGSKPELHGHTWDGDLQEYNYPLPRWWMWLFYITIVFGFAYLALYPGLGVFAGYFGWSSSGQYQGEKAAAAASYGPIYEKYAKLDLAAIAADGAARNMGQRLFLNYCAQCHGSDGGGARGFPNLTDHDWLYGGDLQTIRTTIAAGRTGVMPPFGQVLGTKGVSDVAYYVLSLSGFPADGLQVFEGRKIFAANCAACHGPAGKGNTAMGAPNLTDRIWLHGGTPDKVMETISKGRMSQMPPHKELLDEARINLLTAYAYKLSDTTTR